MVDILLIEDNEELGTLLCDFLRRDGFSVFHTETGEEGLAYCAGNPVKLVLLDIMLPGLDGFSVCGTIREKANIPILTITTNC